MYGLRVAKAIREIGGGLGAAENFRRKNEIYIEIPPLLIPYPVCRSPKIGVAHNSSAKRFRWSLYEGVSLFAF